MRRALLALLLTASIQAQTTAIRFGKLIQNDGTVVRDAVVVVDGERIAGVGTSVPPNAKVIDLRPLTGLPGLVDVHTHMTYYWDRTPGTRPWSQLGTLHPAVTLFLAQENARKALDAGVTTVRDLGSYEYLDVAMRDLINRGAMNGPRMFVAGYGLTVSNSPSELRPNPPWLGPRGRRGGSHARRAAADRRRR
jgi:imidazolonepropionase-like amidohydrolase